MTAIFYPDCHGRSPDGGYRIEARSPNNGTIGSRPEQPARSNKTGFWPGAFQRDFRYQLIDTRSGRVLWERWQHEREDSPHEVVASNSGWSILRLHGFAPQ